MDGQAEADSDQLVAARASCHPRSRFAEAVAEKRGSRKSDRHSGSQKTRSGSRGLGPALRIQFHIGVLLGLHASERCLYLRLDSAVKTQVAERDAQLAVASRMACRLNLNHASLQKAALGNDQAAVLKHWPRDDGLNGVPLMCCRRAERCRQACPNDASVRRRFAQRGRCLRGQCFRSEIDRFLEFGKISCPRVDVLGMNRHLVEREMSQAMHFAGFFHLLHGVLPFFLCLLLGLTGSFCGRVLDSVARMVIRSGNKLDYISRTGGDARFDGQLLTTWQGHSVELDFDLACWREI